MTTDSGENVVLPFLMNSGVTKIDAMIISHGDNDHIGGAASILAAVSVRRIYTSVPQRFNHINTFYCYAGQSWQWDQINFKVLGPEKNTTFRGNNASCILQISTANNSILLTGDMEKDAEQSLLKTGDDLKATILVAPHHGSATSSTPAFIAATQPQFVLFPVGYRNKFHFPAKSVVKRYDVLGANLFDTATYGAISFKLSNNANGITYDFYRDTARRYWETK